MLKVVILTTSLKGTASVAAKALSNCSGIYVQQVCLVTSPVVKNRRFYIKKFRKVLKIGFGGALIGLLLRRVFYTHSFKYMEGFDYLDSSPLGIDIKRYQGYNQQLRSDLEQFETDFLLSLGNSYIPESIYSVSRCYSLNVHHELLPALPNAMSVFWRIYYDFSDTGFSIHVLSKQIDMGELKSVCVRKIDWRRSFLDCLSYNYAVSVMESGRELKRLLVSYTNSGDLPNARSLHERLNVHTTPTLMQYIHAVRNYKKLRKQCADL